MDKRKISHVGKCLLIEEGKRKTLVIGDLHLGYENALSASGIFVTRFLMEQIINDLNAVFAKTGNVDEIVLLGDIKHSFGNILKQEWGDIETITNFLRERSEKIVFVRGNHDVMTFAVGKWLGFEVVDYYIKKGIAFVHGDRNFKEIWNKDVNLIVMGHLHPAVEISDKTKTEKYKCFLEGKYKGKNMTILPSFTEASKGADPRDIEDGLWKINFGKFRVFAVGDDLNVYDFGLLQKI